MTQNYICVMENIQLLQVTPKELVALFQESVRQILPHPQEPNQKEILTRKETAILFSVSLVCVHDWINKGLLKPYKLGNKTYFKRSEVLDVLYNSNRV